MKFLIDAQLPPRLAAALRETGLEAVAVREVNLQEADDSAIWHYALQTQAIIVTKDEDFAERCVTSVNPPTVVWLRIGNATNPTLLTWFLPMLPAVIERIQSGDRLIEVR